MGSGFDSCALWRKVASTVAVRWGCLVIFKIIYRGGVKYRLGIGWLRAVAQGYSYSDNKMTLWSNFQKNLLYNAVGAWMAARGGARLQLQVQ